MLDDNRLIDFCRSRISFWILSWNTYRPTWTCWSRRTTKSERIRATRCHMVTFARCHQFRPPICWQSSCACTRYSVAWPTFIRKASVIVISSPIIFSLIRKRVCSRYAISEGKSVFHFILLTIIWIWFQCQTFTSWRFSRFLYLCSILSSSRAAVRCYRLHREDRFVSLMMMIINQWFWLLICSDLQIYGLLVSSFPNCCLASQSFTNKAVSTNWFVSFRSLALPPKSRFWPWIQSMPVISFLRCILGPGSCCFRALRPTP